MGRAVGVMRARSGRVWLFGLLVVLVGALISAAPADACTSAHSYSEIFGIPLGSDYQDCSVIDLDQRRTALDGRGGLPGDGDNFCVPTSAMDWMAWLSKYGYINPGGYPPNEDWTKPSNFDAMSTYINLMGAFMGTTAAHGTSGSGLTSGLLTWLFLFTHVKPLPGQPRIPGLPVIENVYQQVNGFSPDPNLMGVDAAEGALVMVNIGFYNSDGKRTGGHEVAYQQGTTSLSDRMVTIHVMDPNNPPINDHVQSPYHADKWVLKAKSDGLWSVNGTIYNSSRTSYDGWSEIDPELVFSFDAPTVHVDAPFRLVASREHARISHSLALPGKARVLDLAVAPQGTAEPFLRAGSSTIYEVDRISGKVRTYAQGPARANHLTYGGPDENLFVAGASQLVALNRAKRTIARAQLPGPVDALAWDAEAGQLVALSAAQDQIEFYSPTLTLLRSAAVPASILAGEGNLSLAVGPNGALYIHRDGQPTVAEATPATSGAPLDFEPVKLQRAPAADGLAIDDRGDMFVSSGGRLVELLSNGERAPGSYFDGMPAGPIVRVARSFSNLPPDVTFQ